MTREKYKILQIIPADGWFVKYKDESNKSHFLSKIACWALIEEEDGLRGIMAMGGDNDCYLDFSEDDTNFVGYYWVGETPSLTSK